MSLHATGLLAQQRHLHCSILVALRLCQLAPQPVLLLLQLGQLCRMPCGRRLILCCSLQQLLRMRCMLLVQPHLHSAAHAAVGPDQADLAQASSFVVLVLDLQRSGHLTQFL